MIHNKKVSNFPVDIADSLREYFADLYNETLHDSYDVNVKHRVESS